MCRGSGLLLRLFQAQGKPMSFTIDPDNFDRDKVAFLEDLRGMSNMPVG
jgi:hypothetical protein